MGLVRAIASKSSSGLWSAFAQQSFESWFVVTRLVEPLPKIRCNCPVGLVLSR